MALANDIRPFRTGHHLHDLARRVWLLPRSLTGHGNSDVTPFAGPVLLRAGG